MTIAGQRLAKNAYPRQRMRLEKWKLCHEIDTRFVATDETDNNRRSVRGGGLSSVRPKL
jgi:hypothetical protein